MKKPLKTSGRNARSNKQRGEWAELCFMAKATERGFNITKPWGDCLPYDVAIDLDGRLIRVQVKSASYRRKKPKYNYVSHLSRNTGQRYRPSDFDYLALYVVPKDVWYIIPVAIAAWRKTIEVCPGYKRNQYEQYREAWQLLREGAQGQRGITIHAMADCTRSAAEAAAGSVL